MMSNRIYVRGASNKVMVQKDQDAITADQLVGIRRQVKIGDTISVKTYKGCNVDEGESIKTGTWRKGTVIGIFRNFAHVRLQGGVCESVLWVDVMNSGKEETE